MSVFEENSIDQEKRLAFERRLTETRTVARACALQAAYVFDTRREVLGDEYFNYKMKEADLQDLLEEICDDVRYFYENVFFAEKGTDEWRKRVDEKYFKTIVWQFLTDVRSMEGVIESCLNAPWTIEKLSRSVRVVILIASSELKHNIKTNEKILISAYVDLAGEFCTFAQTGFVNGVLDRIAKVHFRR